MKLEDQVTSLKLSERLKELGVKQDSLFYWITLSQTQPYVDYAPNGTRFRKEVSYSAYTCSELGEMLPENSVQIDLRTTKNDGSYMIEYLEFGRVKRMEGGEENEANVRAEMLIYLLENSLLAL